MKKGKAQVKIISIVLIIMIILVATTIIWKVVKGTVKEKSEEIDIEIITANLRIENVFINENNWKLQLMIERGGDNLKLSSLRVVVLGDNQEVYTITNLPDSLESNNYVLNISGIDNIKEILVYPVSEKGKFGVGEKYSVKGNELNEIDNELEIINYDKEVSCVSNLQCEVWDDCHVVYDIEDIINGGILLQGEQTRLCEDINECISNVIERQECDPGVSVILEKVEKCDKEYLEVHDEDKQKLISRLELIEGRLYIQFILDQAEYFPYCYNNIMDCEETGIDCGGDCASCESI